jgi:N-acetylmuramoyl-L-alanine amidase
MDLAIARALADADAGLELPTRDVTVGIAERVEALAEREGAGPRAAALHEASAKVLERAWRVFGAAPDGARAVARYRVAARDMRTPVACESAIRGARLAGDIARDPAVAYAELFRAGLRAVDRGDGDGGMDPKGATSCARAIASDLAAAEAFRPPQADLDAIVTDVESQGGLAALAPAAVRVNAAPKIVRVDVWPGADATRVVVELDRPAPYRAVDEIAPDRGTPRTFVELDGVDPGNAPKEAIESGVVRRVGTEATSTGSRVLLDLDGKGYRRIFYMREPYRVVIDVARKPPGAGSPGALRQVSRVVVDAGHGGRDSGAVGPNGVAEKDVTLDVARRLQRILESQDIRVLLTRDDDRFVSLEERTARANAFGADLFVSIHCNASEGRGRRGVETYVLDATRDEVAARVAARENDTTRAASADVAAMLARMPLADQTVRSTRFARLLERSAVAALRMRFADIVDGGVHPAGFYVLVGARMPGVLFESSYISNPTDERRLASDEYRQLLADAVANAIRAYREGR